jgi:glycosyltransferase involved in cell wall biosynthesis
MKRLRMILRYDAGGASSRVRGIELSRFMDREVGILVPGDTHWRRRYYTAAISPRTVYIQKRASRRDIQVAHLRRRMGFATVFDLDDAPGGVEEKVEQEARVAEMMAAATAVTVGSRALEAFAGRYAQRVTRIPSAVDTDLYHPEESVQSRPVTVGWIGNGAGYLDELSDLARIVGQVRARTRIGVVIIGAMHRPEIHAAFGHDDDRVVDSLDWEHEEAIVDAMRDFDIGVYPLRDTRYNGFKCGYKAIQYMALGLPVVASPTGENTHIVRDRNTGYLAGRDDEWVECLCALAGDAGLRRRLGAGGRTDAVERYSMARAASLLDRLLDDIERS